MEKARDAVVVFRASNLTDVKLIGSTLGSGKKSHSNQCRVPSEFESILRTGLSRSLR